MMFMKFCARSCFADRQVVFIYPIAYSSATLTDISCSRSFGAWYSIDTVELIWNVTLLFSVNIVLMVCLFQCYDDFAMTFVCMVESLCDIPLSGLLYKQKLIGAVINVSLFVVLRTGTVSGVSNFPGRLS